MAHNKKCRVCNPPYFFADFSYNELLRRWQLYDDAQKHYLAQYGEHGRDAVADWEEKKRVLTKLMAKKVFGINK